MSSEPDWSRNLDLFCPECRYSLRGLQHPRCPECGLDLSFITSLDSVIPWCDRSRNPIETFIRTAGLAMFRPKRLLREFYRPVDYRAAQAFRWVCVVLAFGGILAAAAVINAFHPELLEGPVEQTGWWFIGVIALGVLLALIAITGIPSYFFHPKWLPVELQNRAIALSYYACAPLALTPIASAIIALVEISDTRPADKVAVCVTLMVALVVLGFTSAWLLTGHFSWRLMNCSRRQLVFYLLVPAIQFAAAVTCVIGLPAIVYYVALVYFSLR